MNTRKQTALTRVRTTDHALRRALDDLDSAVRRARAAGCTWADLATIFGTTRQAAQLRFRYVGTDRKLIG